MRRLSSVVVLGVLVGLGGYVLIYLFRWEWHRAMMMALFFVAMETGLGVALVLRRLLRLEQRLDELEHPVAPKLDPAVLERLRESAPPPKRPFAWLDPQDQRLSVFLPFLLGFGALASLLAWLVEQFARHTTSPALERRLAMSLLPLALPAGGLLGADQPSLPTASRLPWPRRLLPVLAVGLTVVVGAAAVDWLSDELQTRPDPRRADISTRIDVQLRGVRASAWPEQAAATLWGTCSHVLHGRVGPAKIRSLSEGRFEIIVPTDIGPSAQARMRGCLHDAVVDRVQANVLAIEAVTTS